MKKILIYSLILTFIFPAYCIANPRRALPTEQEIRDEVLLIIEDGVAEQEEISLFLERLIEGEAIAYVCACFTLIGLIIMGLAQLDFSGTPLEIYLDLLLLDIGVYWISLIFVVCFFPKF